MQTLTLPKIKLSTAQQIANHLLCLLKPHCLKIEIAGSIRRGKEYVKDIEIVCIPKPYEIGLFESGIASVVNRWQATKGQLPCKYTQRKIPITLIQEIIGIDVQLPSDLKLDLFIADKTNWGYQLAIRTGSADYSHYVLANGWVKAGFQGKQGYLHRVSDGKLIAVQDEAFLFQLIGIPWVEPSKRDLINHQ